MFTTTEPRFSAGILQRPRPPWWWASLQITALAAHRPLALLTGPTRAVTNAMSVVILCGLVGLAGITVYTVLLRLRVSAWKALSWVSFGTLLFWHASGLGIGLPLPSWLLQIALIGLVMTAAGRFAEHRYMKIGLFVGSLTLGGTLALNAGVAAFTTPPPVVGVQHEAQEFEFQSRPDIFLVILDGYARSDVIRRVFGYDNSSFEIALEDAGVDVFSKATANYPVTHFSIPSLLNMSYMHRGPGPISNSDLSSLAEGIAGDNAVVRTVKANGYEYVHGETITQYNHCGDQVDICLEGPLLDLTMYRLLQNTPIGGLFYSKTGDPATWLNLKRIDQMRNWAVMKGEPADKPTFTFLHLILPHPPLFLDRDCKVRLDPDLHGSEMIRDDVPSDRFNKRLEGWVEQVQCANQTVLDFVDQIDGDDVVIITSDHGSDATYRLFGDISQYTEEALAERMPTFTAARLPEPCQGETPDDVALVNLFRYVFACLSDEAPDPLPNRAYVASFGGYVFEVKSPG